MTPEQELLPRVIGRLKWAATHYMKRNLTLEELEAFTAYVMATVKHETAGTFMPIPERGGEAYFIRRYGPETPVGKTLGNLSRGDAVDFAGKGYVQITGRNNYHRVGVLLGLQDLLTRFPHMAMQADISLAVTVDGMLNGWFTGMSMQKAYKRYGLAFQQWRRIVNVLDKADLIAGYADRYLDSIPEQFPAEVKALALNLIQAASQKKP